MKSIHHELRRAWEQVRRRHPLVSLLLVIRKTFRPFVNWDIFDVFETDLRLPLPESYSKGKFDVRIYGGPKDLKRTIEDLTSFNDLLPVDIELRFGRGDVVGVAYAADQVVGCMWLTFANGTELEFGTSWIMNAAEALRYDSFVRPDWRGRAIHSLLNDALNRYARERGILRTLGEISVLNSQSLSLPKHLRRVRTMRVVVFHVRGLNWTYRKAVGAPFESRFAIEPGLPNRNPRYQFGNCHGLCKIIGPVAHSFPFQTPHETKRKTIS